MHKAREALIFISPPVSRNASLAIVDEIHCLTWCEKRSNAALAIRIFRNKQAYIANGYQHEKQIAPI